MDVTVTGRHVSVTPAMKDYAREKVLRCDKFRPTLTSAHIVMNVEKFRHKVEINVMAARHINLHVEAVSEDMYKSIDGCIDKLTQQLRKFKGKVQHHKTKEGLILERLREFTPLPASLEETSEMPALTLIHREAIVKKPMTLDEAILEMKVLNDDFFVFYNAKTQCPNVLYRITPQRCGHLKGPVKARRDGKVIQTADVYSLKSAADLDSRPKKITQKKVTLEKIAEEKLPERTAEMKKNYLIFANAATNQLNVLYRRRDGKCGWIE